MLCFIQLKSALRVDCSLNERLLVERGLIVAECSCMLLYESKPDQSSVYMLEVK